MAVDELEPFKNLFSDLASNHIGDGWNFEWKKDKKADGVQHCL